MQSQLFTLAMCIFKLDLLLVMILHQTFGVFILLGLVPPQTEHEVGSSHFSLP